MVDLLRAADLDCQLRAVTVTAGMHETYAKGFYHVPKKNLIVGLQVLLQRGGLQIPAGLAFHGEFLEEISSMRVRAGSGGHEQYGAWRRGSMMTWCLQWLWLIGGLRREAGCEGRARESPPISRLLGT